MAMQALRLFCLLLHIFFRSETKWLHNNEIIIMYNPLYYLYLLLLIESSIVNALIHDSLILVFTLRDACRFSD